ncbi:isocitrate lyase/PEP mutase family protein [Actinoplanes sp. CA-030573]|uniref:isocitrate lyase/PEP mutase family protein n=1 Tax=Actinoplanes sp. CA-030573 TaxID=3239898 RepID=UPI003D8D9206
MTGAEELRALLAAGQVTHAPGVYDPVTAALAVAAGHRAVHLSGTGVSALMLGRPDLGIVRATQIADRAATLSAALGDVPLIADVDTGYGDPRNAVWTGYAYVRAGVSGLHIGDRAEPGEHGAEVIGVDLAAEKIAALAREVPELVVIARTDAYARHGLAGVIERCEAYAAAGADAVFPGGVEDLDELARLHDALPGVPIVISRSEAETASGAVSRAAASSAGVSTAAASSAGVSRATASTAGVSRATASSAGVSRATASKAAVSRAAGAGDDDLAAAGVRLVLHPMAALLAALRAASQVYRQIADTGSAEPVDRLPWAAFTALIPEQAAREFEARYTPGDRYTPPDQRPAAGPPPSPGAHPHTPGTTPERVARQESDARQEGGVRRETGARQGGPRGTAIVDGRDTYDRLHT